MSLSHWIVVIQAALRDELTTLCDLKAFLVIPLVGEAS